MAVAALIPARLGTSGLADRVSALGGSLEIESPAGAAHDPCADNGHGAERGKP